MNLLENCYISFVNLDLRKDRLHKMEKELARVNLPAVRTRGQLPSEYQGDPARVKVMQDRTPGAIGCHFSQVKIMFDAMSRNQHAFVMEDDLVFCDDFHERMAIISAFCETHAWDVIWLGGTFHIHPPHWHKHTLGRDAQRTDHPRMMRTFGAFCTYAYIINKDSLPNVLLGLDEQLETSIGIDYAFIQMQPKLKTFAFVPGCITQYDNQSNIGTGMTRFSRFAKLGPHWFQQRMRDFDPDKYNWHEAGHHTDDVFVSNLPPEPETSIVVTHRRDLWKLIENVDGDLAEIGVAEGLFSNDMLSWPIQRKLYMVDRWQRVRTQKGDASMPQEWHDRNFREAMERVEVHGKRAVPLRGASVDMALRVPNQSLALCYIDGDHSYEGVMADLKAWVPKVVPGGVVALHDFEATAYGVKRAVQEFCRGKYAIAKLPEDKLEDAGACFRIV